LSATPATPDPATHRYPPLEQYFGPSAALGAPRRRTRVTPARVAARLREDGPFRLAVAIAIPVLLMEMWSNDTPRVVAVAGPVAYITVQLGLALVNRQPRWWSLLRLGLSLVFVLLANVAIDASGTWPLNALVIPIVALAAAVGGRPALLLAGLGIAMSLLPLVATSVSPIVDRSSVAIALAAIVMANGSRRMVSTLEQSATRLRRANARDRRRARQLSALETVGRILARDGLTSDALDQVMSLLEDTFGYRYPSVYFLEGDTLRLGAQRNYRNPIESIPADRGVIGRSVRTREPILLRDAPNDPDFQSADPAIVDEIAVPLRADDDLFGVLSVETDVSRRLDEEDLATMLIVGDRIAAAMALGRERTKLALRAQLLDRLTRFATALNASLDPVVVHAQIATGAAQVVGADIVAVVTRDPNGDGYSSVAVDGGDPSMVGSRIVLGQGVAGTAIATRRMYVNDHFRREDAPDATSRLGLPPVMAAMGVPLIFGDEVLGAVTFVRTDEGKPFVPIEQEIAYLVASRIAVALTNATLHHEAQEAAITDALTGLHNRRHFDASVSHADALRARLHQLDRRERSAILFDLDHFGAINKRYGHQVGDDILRRFAMVLKSRVRASDLVARYGGEEFIVILDGASRDEAVRLADEIRVSFRQGGIDAADSGLPITTVSAGCASLLRTETDASILLGRADVGLAMAKAGGRDQVVAA